MIGQTISHYLITEKLGEGGMGVVYKAQDLKLDRPVALKFLPPHLLGSEDVRKRFEREAKAAAALQHPNICPVYEIDEVDGRMFIAMAFLEGEELTKRIEEGPLSVERLLDIGIQVARGLQEAHGKGVVHRDIKPANIMDTTNGQAVLMDFGLALLASSSSKLTQEGVFAGDDGVGGEQAVSEGVLGRTLLALGCPRSGGFFRVFSISVDLFIRSHWCTSIGGRLPENRIRSVGRFSGGGGWVSCWLHGRNIFLVAVTECAVWWRGAGVWDGNRPGVRFLPSEKLGQRLAEEERAARRRGSGGRGAIPGACRPIQLSESLATTGPTMPLVIDFEGSRNPPVNLPVLFEP